MPPRRARYVSAIASVLLWCPSDVLAQAQAAGQAESTPTLSALKQGRASLDRGDLDRARTYFEAALARDPTSAEAHFLLGVVYERQKDFAAAAASYAKAIDYAPRMAEAHDRLGFVLGQQGQTRGGHPPVRTGRPARSRALRRAVPPRRHALVDAGISPARFRALQAAVRLRPDHAEARYYLGLTLEQPRTARAGDRAAARSGPVEPAAGRRCRLRLGTALRGIRRSRRRDRPPRGRRPPRPVGADAQNSLGLALSHAGRGDDAVAVLRATRHGAADLRSGAAEPRHRPDAAGQPGGRRERCTGLSSSSTRPTPKRSTTSGWR